MSKKRRNPVEVLKDELEGEVGTGNRFIDLAYEYCLLLGNENAPDDVVQAQNLRRDEIIKEINALPLRHPEELAVRLDLLGMQLERHLPASSLIAEQISAGLLVTAQALSAMHIKQVASGEDAR